MIGVHPIVSPLVAGGGKGRDTYHSCRMGKEDRVLCSDRPRAGGVTLFLKRRLNQNLAHRLHGTKVSPHYHRGGVRVQVRVLPTEEESCLIIFHSMVKTGSDFLPAGSMRKECCLITIIGNAGDRALPTGYKGAGYTAFPPQESGGSVSSSPSPAGEGHAQHWEMGMKDRVPAAAPIWGGSGYRGLSWCSLKNRQIRLMVSALLDCPFLSPWRERKQVLEGGCVLSAPFGISGLQASPAPSWVTQNTRKKQQLQNLTPRLFLVSTGKKKKKA